MIIPLPEPLCPLGKSLNGKKKKSECGFSFSDTTETCTIVGVTFSATSMKALLKLVALASRFTGGFAAPRLISAKPGRTTPKPETKIAPKIIPTKINTAAPNKPL